MQTRRVGCIVESLDRGRPCLTHIVVTMTLHYNSLSSHWVPLQLRVPVLVGVANKPHTMAAGSSVLFAKLPVRYLLRMQVAIILLCRVIHSQI